MQRHPTFHAHADGGDLVFMLRALVGAAHPYADAIVAALAAHVEGGQRADDPFLERGDEATHVGLSALEVEHHVDHTLAAFNVRGERREDRIGVWVARPEQGEGREDKIAAIGIRIRKWVSLHGISLNVDPDLSHFSGIVPCGVSAQRYGVTSLVDLGRPVTLHDVDLTLKNEFENLFGPAQALAKTATPVT